MSIELPNLPLLGYRKDGRPIVLIAGAAPDDDDNNEPDDKNEPDDNQPDDKGGKSKDDDDPDRPGDDDDLEKWKRFSRKNEERARTNYEKVQTQQKQLDELNRRLKDIDDKDKSEVDKLREQVESSTKTLDETRRELVAARKGRPEWSAEQQQQFASRLQGDTIEELSADADQLLDIMPKPEKSDQRKANGGAGSGHKDPPKSKGLDEQIRDAEQKANAATDPDERRKLWTQARELKQAKLQELRDSQQV